MLFQIRQKMTGIGRAQGGNALFMVLIALALLASLTYAVSQQANSDVDFSETASDDEQIARMLTYSGTLAAAINQMIVAGAKADTLYSNLNTEAPSSGTFNSGTHTFKIYHPMGGGVNYVVASGAAGASDTVATSYGIVPAAIVTDIGPTDATVGDILFKAKIKDAAACGRINWLLHADATVPALATANFDTLFTSGSAITIAAGNCAGCVGISQICVSNTEVDEFGYYATLLPG